MAGDNQNSVNVEGECASAAKQTLSYEQVRRLEEVVNGPLVVEGRGHYPNLAMTVRKLIVAVRKRLEQDGMSVEDVRINGSAANHIVIGGNEGNQIQAYNDIDLIFRLDQPPNKPSNTGTKNDNDFPGYDLHKVKDSALLALLEFFASDVCLDHIGSSALSEAYGRKMVKIDPTSLCPDRWSLITLKNLSGPDVEMKFVCSMRRPYEFSVDSFQIIVDSFLQFCDVLPEVLATGDGFYPTVIVESAYGDCAAAVDHSIKKLIATKCPEQIRGGGLLKYCYLKARGFKPAPCFDASNLERYMSARFFIDFQDNEKQRNQFIHYLQNHFKSDSLRCIRQNWLRNVREVVGRSCVVQTDSRNETVNLLDELISLERSMGALESYQMMPYWQPYLDHMPLHGAMMHCHSASYLSSHSAAMQSSQHKSVMSSRSASRPTAVVSSWSTSRLSSPPAPFRASQSPPIRSSKQAEMVSSRSTTMLSSPPPTMVVPSRPKEALPNELVVIQSSATQTGNVDTELGVETSGEDADDSGSSSMEQDSMETSSVSSTLLSDSDCSSTCNGSVTDLREQQPQGQMQPSFAHYPFGQAHHAQLMMGYYPMSAPHGPPTFVIPYFYPTQYPVVYGQWIPAYVPNMQRS